MVGGLLVSASPRGTSESRLALGNTGIPWWRSDRAPARWTGPIGSVQHAVQWRSDQRGVAWGELELRGSGAAWRTRVILLRLRPGRLRISLANGVSPDGGVPGWTIGDAPAPALAAFNAGQFSGAAAWGWVRHAGRDYRAPRQGPLAAAVMVRRDGAVVIGSDAAVDSVRTRATDVVEAFQSYPRLLDRGMVPNPLRRDGLGLDRGHRDARLALGTLPDGVVLVALTRFDGLGASLGGVPFGLTLPETAALMGALGCVDAVALDGGISAQLVVRDPEGEHRWPGYRAVPLALVATRR